jgi:hypothetical protein
LREHGNDLEEPAGREAVDRDLAAEAAGEEGVELVVLSGCHVDLGRRVAGGEVGRFWARRLAREHHAGGGDDTGCAHDDATIQLER